MWQTVGSSDSEASSGSEVDMGKGAAVGGRSEGDEKERKKVRRVRVRSVCCVFLVGDRWYNTEGTGCINFFL